MDEFSVVICAYTEERWEDLLAAIASVQRQSQPPLETILVVDHNPALFEMAKDSLPGVTVLENKEARGLSGARNTGLQNVRGDFVAFLDEDAQADPDWLEQLNQGYFDPDVSGVGGFIEPRWDTGKPSWFPEEFLWVVGCSYRGLPEGRGPVRNLIGANMSFRRQVFSTTGGFRTGMGRIGKTPVGCEETELCIRARQRTPASILLFQPDARVVHRVTASRARLSYFVSRCYSEGLSKALVTQFVGSRDGLQSERKHALLVLPQGVWRGIREGLKGDFGGFLRAGAIVLGLGCTTAGYVMGLLSQRSSGKGKPQPLQPTGTPRTST